MKYLVIAFISLHAFAAETGQIIVGDSAIGTFIISKTSNMEPVWHPIRYKLSVQCKGESKARVLKDVKICRMLGHVYDDSTKDLQVEYEIGITTSATESPCETPATSKHRVTYKNLNEECGKKK